MLETSPPILPQMLGLHAGVVGETVELAPICHGKERLFVEFFNLKCTRCPAALAKLRQEVPSWPGSVRALVCCLSTGGNDDIEAGCAAEMLCMDDEGDEWATFAFMRFAEKEALKAQLAFATLPFCAVFDLSHRGCLVGSGDPTNSDVRGWLQHDVSPQAPSNGRGPIADGAALAASSDSSGRTDAFALTGRSASGVDASLRSD